MFGDHANVVEGSASLHLEPGVHKVHIENMSLEQLNTPKYQGSVAKITFRNETGKKLEHKIFPFKFNDRFTHRDGSPMNETEQLNEYKTKCLHLFSKACDKQAYLDAASSSQNFEQGVANTSKLVSRLSGGKDFYILVVADKNGYSVYPEWTNNCAASDENTLVFNPEKHGRKPKPEGMETTSSQEGDDMPF
jgi:hypothetical protein